MKGELQTAKLRQEQFAEYREEADQLREENKQLAQDHAEDQQVIHLLEMQKDILTKGQVCRQKLCLCLFYFKLLAREPTTL